MGGGACEGGGPYSFLFNRKKSRSGGCFDRSKGSAVYEKTPFLNKRALLLNPRVLGVIVCVSNKNGKIKSEK